MEVEKIQKFIEKHVGLIAISAQGVREAQERAGKFLIVSSVLLSTLKDLEISMTKTKTLNDATYAQAMLGEGKVTEKRIAAQSEAQFVQARERHEENEAYRAWLKGFVKVFDNAHIFYRTISKEG